MRLVSVLFTTVAAAVTISAAPIVGTLNFTGNAQLSTNTVNFQCNLTGACAGTNGDFFITDGPANTGTFAQISILNRFGQVSDINNPALGVPISIPDFASFLANPDVVLDLTEVFAGTGAPCPPSGPVSCTPTGSALNLLTTPTGTVGTFSVLANARRISTGEITHYQGLFTLQFTQPPAQVLSALASGRTTDTSYSATFSPISSVPEPSTYGLLGAGLALLTFVKARRKA